MVIIVSSQIDVHWCVVRHDPVVVSDHRLWLVESTLGYGVKLAPVLGTHYMVEL